MKRFFKDDYTVVSVELNVHLDEYNKACLYWKELESRKRFISSPVGEIKVTTNEMSFRCGLNEEYTFVPENDMDKLRLEALGRMMALVNSKVIPNFYTNGVDFLS